MHAISEHAYACMRHEGRRFNVTWQLLLVVVLLATAAVGRTSVVMVDPEDVDGAVEVLHVLAPSHEPREQLHRPGDVTEEHRVPVEVVEQVRDQHRLKEPGQTSEDSAASV